MSVRQWCQVNEINISPYYKWQRKDYATAQAQQENCFVEVTPSQPAAIGGVPMAVRIVGAEQDKMRSPWKRCCGRRSHA